VQQTARELGADVLIMAHDPDPEAGGQQTALMSITLHMVTLTHPFLHRLLDILFRQGIGKSRLPEARLIGS